MLIRVHEFTLKMVRSESTQYHTMYSQILTDRMLTSILVFMWKQDSTRGYCHTLSFMLCWSLSPCRCTNSLVADSLRNEEFDISYPEIFPLSTLIACNAMNWPGGDALSFSYRFHHWLMQYTLGQYIVNGQSSTTSDRFSTIFIFGIWSDYKGKWQVPNKWWLCDINLMGPYAY